MGHGRGATSFANAWLNHNGIETRHEALGPDGIVDSGMSVPTYPIRQGLYAGLKRDEIDFDHKLTVVRNPWKTIATYYTVEHPDAIWLHEPHISLEEAGHDELSATCLSVVRWTRSALAYGPTYIRAEEWNVNAPQWLVNQGFADRDWLPLPANLVNHQKGRRFTREEIIGRVPASIAQEVKEFAEELGYE